MYYKNIYFLYQNKPGDIKLSTDSSPKFISYVPPRLLGPKV